MRQPSDEIVPRALDRRLAAHIEAHASPYQIGSKSERLHVVFEKKDRRHYALESRLEGFLRPRVRILGKSLSAYNTFGVFGIALLIVIACTITAIRGLSFPIMTALLLLALFISVLNIVLTMLITGRDSLVYLRYFLSIMAAAALMLRIIERPVLPYLEALMLGVGAIQGIGRIGCFRVGCCYGKPASFGVRYTSLHARAGFPDALVGVRLFPIQLLESIWILISVGTGITIALSAHIEGAGLSTYIVLFSTGRFCSELLRGDVARTQMGSLSEAQWISLTMVFAVVALEFAGVLSFFFVWHAVTAGALLIGVVYLLYVSRHSSIFKLKKPVRIQALARAIAVLEKGRTQHLAGVHAVHLRRVGDSLQISDGLYRDGENRIIHHFTLSYADKKMSAKDAVALAKLIRCWHSAAEKYKLVTADWHTYHFLRYHPITHTI